MTIDTVETAVGPAQVLHRLALAVECLDAVGRRRLRGAVLIGREVDDRLLARGREPWWPCLDLERRGPARAFVRFDFRTPSRMRLRLLDPARRVVPRRIELPLWALADIKLAEGSPPAVPGTSRLLRPWLLPGTAAGLPRGTTAVRGSVVQAGTAVRWPRLVARRVQDNQVVGYAHGDDRGEFLLVVTGTGTLPPPAPTALDVELHVTAPDPATRPEIDLDDPSTDPYADLVVESIELTATPPSGAAYVEDDVLRGRATPAGYLPSTIVPTLTVPVGHEHVVGAGIEFTP